MPYNIKNSKTEKKLNAAQLKLTTDNDKVFSKIDTLDNALDLILNSKVAKHAFNKEKK